MKKADLYREWARVLDMCEGTGVNPCSAWKFKGFLQDDKLPDFEYDNPERFEFLVAVLKDRPVFVGDKVYGKYSKTFYTVSKEMIDKGEHDYSDNNYWSWNPPKKTFMLNGEKLPCPQKDYSAFNLDLNSWGPYGRKNGSRYYFKSESDLDAAINALHNLLQDATK